MGIQMTSYIVHLSGSSAALDSTISALEKQVKDIKHDNLRGYISAPDHTLELPSSLNNAEGKKSIQDINALVEERVQALIGGTPVVRRRAATAFDKNKGDERMGLHVGG